MTQNHVLDVLFYPKSIALIGISENPAKFGGGFWTKVIQERGFSGDIYPVSAKGGRFNGLNVYSDLKDIPAPVDLVIVSIPAQFTPRLMEDCVAQGVKAVQLYTAGFSETGEKEGIELERQLVRIARQGGIRIIGPNCMGVFCPKSGISWRLDFPRQSGTMGVMAQSGWNAVEIIQHGALRGLYVNKLVSYGNAADLNESDYIDYFADDPEIRVITAYMEGVRDGRRFLSALKKAAALKPVIIYKGGQTSAGSGAVYSHTSSLAGDPVLWKALLNQTGAIGVSGFEELMDTVIACSYMDRPANRNVAVIGSGGGPSVMAADDCERAGLNVFPFPESIKKELRKLMPGQGTSVRNPVDSPFAWEPENLTKAVRAASDADNVDLLILHAEIDSTVVFMGKDKVRQICRAMIDGAKHSKKPTAFVLRGTDSPEAKQLAVEEQQRFARAGRALFSSIAGAATAVNNLIEYHRRRIHPTG